MAKSKIAAGVELTGKDEGFRAAVDSAKKKMQELKNESKSSARIIEQEFKQVTIAMAKIAGAAIAAKAGFEFLKKGMVQTGEGADVLERFTIKVKAGLDSIAESLYKLDFANMINNWKQASKAAGDYADAMDLVDHRLGDLSVRRASVASSVSTLRAKQVEGTLTKEEAATLKRDTYTLLDVEKQIYDAAIEAQIKYISEKEFLDASLFNTLETGINQRALLNTDERKNLESYVSIYEDYKKKLKEDLRKPGAADPFILAKTGQIVPVGTVPDLEAVNKQLSIYLASLPEVARLQIFEHNIASEEDYKKLLDFYVKRNQLTGEYAGLINKTDKSVVKLTNSEESLLETQQREADARISAAWERAGNASGGKAFSAFDARLRAAGANVGDVSGFGNASGIPYGYVEKGNGELLKQQQLVLGLQDTFQGMFMNIDKGFKGMVDSMLQDLQRLFTYMLARAAIWGLIYVITGGQGKLFQSMGSFGSWMMPKLAEGGIANKPTMAMIGEYSGAASNPEVVAPLSKLKGMLGNQAIDVRLRGKLAGSDIYFSLVRYEEMLQNNT